MRETLSSKIQAWFIVADVVRRCMKTVLKMSVEVGAVGFVIFMRGGLIGCALSETESVRKDGRRIDRTRDLVRNSRSVEVTGVYRTQAYR